MIARLPEGTGKRLASVLEPCELQADFIRTAIERELTRREKRKAKSGRKMV